MVPNQYHMYQEDTLGQEACANSSKYQLVPQFLSLRLAQSSMIIQLFTWKYAISQGSVTVRK